MRFFVLRILVPSLVALAVGSFFLGCTYTAHHEYVNPISPPPPITATIEVNDPNFADPYYLINAANFKFTLKDVTKPIIGYEVLLDGTSLATGNDGTIQFTLFPWGGYSNGSHQVDIKIKIATQSGSLAEHLGAEYYLLEKKFTVIIDSTPPPNITPTASLENGRLTVRWPAIQQKNFYYSIKRSYTSYYNYQSLNDTIFVDTSIDHLVEPGYVGGSMTYKFIVNGYGFYEREIGSVTFDQIPLDYNVSLDDQNIAHVSWTQTPISTDSTVASVTGYTSKTFPLTAQADVAMDTFLLGDAIYYTVEISRKGYSRQAYTSAKHLAMSSNIKPFVDYAMLPIGGKILVMTSNKIYRYSLPAFVLEDSLSYFDEIGYQHLSYLRVSRDETTALVVGDQSTLFRFDPLNFANRSQIDVFNPTISAGGGNAPVTALALGNVTNSGLVTLTMVRSSPTAMLFDINAGVVRWSSFLSYSSSVPPLVSTDGAVMVFDFPGELMGTVFQASSGTYNQIGTVDLGRKYFRTGTNELIVETPVSPLSYQQTASISIIDLSLAPAQFDQPFSVTRSMTYSISSSTETLVELDYDDFTQMLYTRHRDSYHSIIRLRDINDFHYVKAIKAQDFTYGHAFRNNYHFVNVGFIAPVK